MTTPSLPQAKDRTEAAQSSAPLRFQAPAFEGFASPILGLQRAAGNQSVSRLLGGILLQPKLRIGPPGDAYEREADHVAEAVLSESGAPFSVSVAGSAGLQRMCSKCQEEEEERLQRAPAAGGALLQRACHCQEEEDLVQPKSNADAPRSTPGFESRVEALRGSGRPLPADVRSFFEPRFGHDFGAVRVHTGSAADEAAQAVHARAFTVGSDVAFATGEWSPETAAGKRLLAHELTHVVQQTPLVARRKPLLQRETDASAEAEPQGGTEPAVSPEEASPAPEEPTAETPAAEGEPAPAAVVVDDEAETVGPGQMKKSEFFARLRSEVCAAAEAGLAGTQYSAQGCPLIEFWLGYYEGQDTERINRDLPRFAGEGPRPASAEEYIGLIAERVRTSVTTWARTGEITGVPKGIPLAGMGLPGLGSLGGLLGGLGDLGGVFFKAKPGGAHDPGEPVALQARLGAGRPLEGSIRSRMESAFGRSFSHVRVHTDSSAAGLSTGFNARAFTVGSHVAFGPQEYRPGTMIGDALIAHELAHVAQQGDAVAAGPVRAEGAAYQALERDADLATVGAVATMWTGLRGRLRSFPTPQPRMSSGLRLQRCDRCRRCLGLDQQTQPTATTTTVPPPTRPTRPSACQPEPVSLSVIESEDKPGAFAYTKITNRARDIACAPDLVVGTGAKAGTCSFQPLNLHPPTLVSKYARQGDHPTGKSENDPHCGLSVPVVLRVSQEMADLLVTGEQEHCDDDMTAFNRTSVPCAEAVNRLAGTDLVGRNQDQCWADMVRKLHFDPLNCLDETIRLFAVTKLRDDAPRRWHDLETFPMPFASNCAEHIVGLKKTDTTKIGDASVAPEIFVPQATGCSETTPTSGSPPATPPQGGSGSQNRPGEPRR